MSRHSHYISHLVAFSPSTTPLAAPGEACAAGSSSEAEATAASSFGFLAYVLVFPTPNDMAKLTAVEAQ